MPVPKTPDISAPSRPLYEEAFSSGDILRRQTIELDTMTDNARTALLSHRMSNEEKMEILLDTNTAAVDIMATAPVHDNFTDYHRLAVSAEFLNEKIFMPVLFGANTRRIQQFRCELANGTKGKSVDMIALLLDAYARTTPDTPEDRQRIRGAIQEDTIQGLINDPQDGYSIALSSSYYEDTQLGIDLQYYYVATDGASYTIPLSIKSTDRDAATFHHNHPSIVTLSAESIGNLDLHISRLLVKEGMGHPGISEEEARELAAARDILTTQIRRQIPQASGIRIPRQPAQRLLKLPIYEAIAS